MTIRRGKITNLTGNVIIYWDIIRNEKDRKDANYKVLAINFIVSAIPIEDKILTTSFPPIPFRDFDEILEKIQNTNCDIIHGGKMEFPKNNQNLENFYKNQFNHYNKIIEFYISLYKEKFNFSINKLSEEDRISLLSDLVKKSRQEKKISKSKKMIFTSKIQRIISSLKKSDKYDFGFFLSILFEKGKKVDTLLDLYIQKYVAIFYERYEEAQKLKNKINKLKSTI